MHQRDLKTMDLENSARVIGETDTHLKTLENAFAVRVFFRSNPDGDVFRIQGEYVEDVNLCADCLKYLMKMAQKTDVLTEQNVLYAVDCCKNGEVSALLSPDDAVVCVTNRGKPILAKTAGQKRYVDAIKDNTVVFGIGPAGTGKTFLAVAMAVSALKEKKINRIVLTRPAIEAGEKLGFLPGDLQSKIDPYLRPLYDALYEMLGVESYQKMVERGIIEIAPLAYMRGRTLDDAFIILDEAQNATPEQMKMFLTRLGFNAKAVVTGDLTQTDLPRGQRSGLSDAVHVLEKIEGIAVHRFTERDVVRHRLVQKIIEAYEKHKGQEK